MISSIASGVMNFRRQQLIDFDVSEESALDSHIEKFFNLLIVLTQGYGRGLASNPESSRRSIPTSCPLSRKGPNPSLTLAYALEIFYPGSSVCTLCEDRVRVNPISNPETRDLTWVVRIPALRLRHRSC